MGKEKMSAIILFGKSGDSLEPILYRNRLIAWKRNIKYVMLEPPSSTKRLEVVR